MGFLSSLFNSKAADKQDAPASAVEVMCPVSGTAMDITEVSDQVFASKAMGDGIAIKPSEGVLVAPISGTVEALFPTYHALAIKGDNGIGVMLHVGIDTVNMKGEGFAAFISQGDRVEVGQKLVEFDCDKIASAGYEDTTMVIVSELPAGASLAKCPLGAIAQGDRALWLA